MSKRSKVQEQRLQELEAEFQPLLIACLRECAAGRWGLFGQNDHLDPEHRFLSWSEAEHLKEVAFEIRVMRSEFGQPNEMCERFLRLCSLRGSNVSGEPKLAQELLRELDQR